MGRQLKRRLIHAGRDDGRMHAAVARETVRNHQTEDAFWKQNLWELMV